MFDISDVALAWAKGYEAGKGHISSSDPTWPHRDYPYGPYISVTKGPIEKVPVVSYFCYHAASTAGPCSEGCHNILMPVIRRL